MFKKVNLLLILLGLVAFVSCSEKKETKSENNETDIVKETVDIKDKYFFNSYIDPKEFFTLDYTPYLPEDMFVANDVTNLTGQTTNAIEISNAKNAKSVIPGLRELSKYKTKYNTDIAAAADLFYKDTINGPIAKNASTESSSKEPFTVVTWGPKKAIPAKVKDPEFYVMFSEPVVPVAALGSEITSSDIFTIEPPLQGVYRWNGTTVLSFIPSEKIKPEEKYTIKVKKYLTSLSGKKLTGDKEFSTTSEKLKIVWANPGYKFKEQYYEWFYNDDVPPDAAKEYRVQFNYDVNAKDIKSMSKFTIGQRTSTNFEVVQENSNTVTYYINEKLPPETKITLTVGSATSSYSTVRKFKLNNIYAESSYGKYTNPVYIYFSHPINKETVLNNISTSLDYKITKENLEINKTSIIVHGLPVTFNSKYELIIKKGIEDIYGRPLSASEKKEIIVPNAESSARFTDYGSVILEAKYPHVMVFEHQNLLENSVYLLQTTQKPLDLKYPDWKSIQNNPDSVKIPTEPKNERILEKVDLEPLLENGHGMVRFEAITKHPLKQNGVVKGQYENTNVTTIQVTDLGVTARVGINKTVALVSDLSTGKPVANAKVYIYDGRNTSIPGVITRGHHMGMGVSNEDGLAVINYDPYIFNSWLNGVANVKPAILVVTEDDAVTFFPNTHSPWNKGILSHNILANALIVRENIFIFCDRGIYKPGDTVKFRGIDKNLQLGTHAPYVGDYKIEISKNEYRSSNIIELSGTTSENGGFYGSFTLPEDIEPGTYRLRYDRPESQEFMYFEVSYFEKLKFQASLSMPKSNIIAGDKIQSTVHANYLAGGVLAGASYKESWYSEPWYFTTDDKEFKGYRFGPINNTDNMSYLSSNEGNLDGTGKAVLTCDTKENSIKGSPYRYRVSADFSDVSNQTITRSGAVIVHPAQFYIGISKPKNLHYLAKKGEKLNFNYKLALVDGKAVKDLSKVCNNSKKMTLELIREDWNVVQQQGVNGYVYPRYVKEEITEKTKTVDLEKEGTITVTPENVGYYTVRLSSKDSKNRNVVTEYNFFATGSTNSWVMDTEDTDLRLTPDKKMYNPGDTATLLLESPLPAGNYLITVEREGIFTEEVKYFDSAVNTIEIPIARNYLPVVYVSVSSYSVRTEDPKNQYGVADVDKPKGYYGATTLLINPYVKAFTINIKSNKKAYKPGEEATITVKATKGGKPLANAEITLMAVDRGVLDLIDYHVPNPINFFYDLNNFYFCVDGGDSRAFLMDPVTYAIKNLMGGDAMDKAAESKLSQRKDFNPTALFEPVLITDKNGEATCTFTLPDSLTTYRVTAFGIKDELLALQEDEFAVQNKINVQQVTPRRLRERDTSELGVILTNLDSIPHEITVKLETTAPDTITDENGVTKQPGQAFVDGENLHTVTVNPGTTLSVYFDVAAEKAGLINTVFTVNSDILNEQLIYPLIIEKPYIFEQVTTTGAVLNENEETKESIIIPSFAEDGIGKIDITLDATRLGPLGSSVKYLFEYPYCCLEQQSSRVLPLVIFEEYIDVFNMELDEKITSIPKLVKSYFKDWSKLQKENGGFGYWPSSNKADYYVTSKIAETYGQALKRGYTENELKLNKENLVNYLYNGLVEYELQSKDRVSPYDLTPSNKYEADYGAYALSLIAPEKVSKEYLTKTLNSKNPYVAELAINGLIALNIGDKKLAEEFRTAVSQYLRPNTQSIDISDNEDFYCFSYMYNSKNEQLALALQLYAALNPQDPIVTKLVFTLLQNQQTGYWQTTSTTARVLDSFYTLIKASNLDKLKLEASAEANGKTLAEGNFKGPAAQPVKKSISFKDLKIAGVKEGKPNEFTFKKQGRGDLYYTTSMKYALPSEVQIPRDEGLSVVYKLYDDSTGEEITFDAEDSSLVKLESGKIYKVDITLSSTKDRNYIAMRAPVPSGAEILDATFVTTPDIPDNQYLDKLKEPEQEYDNHYMSNQVILDNEIQFFWDQFQKGTTKATFKFRAVRRGVFPTPPITAECMYESEIFGRTYGSLYTIK